MKKSRIKYNDLNILIFSLFFLCVFFVHACDSGTATVSKPVPSERRGQSLVHVAKTYFDAFPSMSADGLKLVFVSGRTEVNRIFKTALTPSQAAPAPLRLTTADTLSEETRAAIAPDGNWVLVEGIKDAKADLFLSSFDGALTAVTTDAGVESKSAFSSDSRFFAFLKTDPATTTIKLFLGQTDALQSTKTVSADGIQVLDFVWIPGSTRLAFVGRDDTTGQTNIYSLQFTDLASADASNATTLATNISISSNNTSLVATSSQILFQKPVPISADTTRDVAEIGDGAAVDRRYLIRSEVGTIDLTSGAVAASPAFAGFSATESSPNGTTADFAQNLTLIREVYRCAVGEDFNYGVELVLSSPDSSSPERLIPQKNNTTNLWGMAKSPCSRTIPTADPAVTDPATLDFSISGATINASATSSQFRLAFITSLTGDYEVRVAERTAVDTYFFYEISQNPKP